MSGTWSLTWVSQFETLLSNSETHSSKSDSQFCVFLVSRTDLAFLLPPQGSKRIRLGTSKTGLRNILQDGWQDCSAGRRVGDMR
jgi:hypothetical protein